MSGRLSLVLSVVAILAVGAVWYMGQSGETITVVEHADTDVVVDLGAAGDSIEDLLTFGNPIYDAADQNKIGTDQGECFRTTPGTSWECIWTVYLADGSISVMGPFLDSLDDSVLAITGGTGKYKGARGEMTLHSRNAAGTAFDFIYEVQH